MRKIIAKITLDNRVGIIQAHPESIDYLANYFTAMDTSQCWQRGKFVKELAKPICFITRSPNDPTGAMIPIGLVGTLKKILDKKKASYKIDDRRKPEAFDFTDKEIIDVLYTENNPIRLRDYQLDAVKILLSNKNGIIKAGTGAGKCLAKGTKVLMYDGSIKNVEDVVVGDKIMGPDSTPRNVLSTTHGKEMMYDVIPVKGEKYTVNESHILSLKYHDDYRKSKSIINISVKDYLSKSDRYKRNCFGYKPQIPLSFEKEETLEYDPYLCGLWLAAGRKQNVSFSVNKNDSEIESYLIEEAKRINGKITYHNEQENSKNISIIFGLKRNPILEYFKSVDVYNNKHVPHVWKTMAIENRIEFLAGYLDGDGHLLKGNTDCFTCSSSNEKITDGIEFISQSLGFSTNKKHRKRYNKRTKKYYHCYELIIGGDIERIPTKLYRKNSPDRRKHDWNITGIKVKPIGEGDYYGFQIDGDRRFVLGDFTVTHNTEIINAWCKLTQKKTLILFKEIKLAHQTLKRMKAAGIDAGIVQGQNVDENHTIVMCTVQSSHKLQREDYEAIIVDECHAASAGRYQDVLRRFNCEYRYGFSATPIVKGNKLKNFKVKSWLGDILHDVAAKKLVDEGYLAKPIITFIRVNKVIKEVVRKDKLVKKEVDIFDLQWQAAERNGIVNNIYRNKMIKTLANNLDGTVLALVKYVDSHGVKLHQEMEDALFLSGKDKLKERNEAVEKLENNEIKTIIASTIFDEGISIDNIYNVILCGGGKSYIKTLQRVGRGMRLLHDDKGNIIKDTVKVYDFYDETHPILERHSEERIKHCEEEGYEVRIKDIKGL